MFRGSNHKKCADTFKGDLYHKDVYMPKQLINLATEMFIKFRNNTEFKCDHVDNNKDCDKCHSYSVELIKESLAKVDIKDINIFEIGTWYSPNDEPNTDIIKFGVRFPYNQEEDVIIFYNSDGTVRTAWLNYKVDNHKTLDRTKYVKRPIKRK